MQAKSRVAQPTSRRTRWVRLVLGLAGTGFLIAALLSQWQTVRDTVEFSWGRIAIALLLTLASIVAIAQGFASLLRDGAHSKRLRRIFYLSQPAKYIPGGIAQPVGQVALTTGEGFTTARSITAFLVHSLTSAAAGAFLGSGVSLVPSAPTWLRVIAGLGLLAPVLIYRPLLTKTARLLARLTRRDLREDLIPDQRHLIRALMWAIIGVLCSAIAFTVLASGSIADPAWVVVSAFAFAFTVGFLAVPFPSGIAIRETVLALILPGTGLATIVAISAVHRLVAMGAELLVVAVTSRRLPRSDKARQGQ